MKTSKYRPYTGPARPVSLYRINKREVAFAIGYRLLGFAMLCVLLMDLFVWRPN